MALNSPSLRASVNSVVIVFVLMAFLLLLMGREIQKPESWDVAKKSSSSRWSGAEHEI
jgi:hypothetical protein